MKKRHTFNKHRTWAKEAMKENPMTRNSDWYLLFQVLENQGIFINNVQRRLILDSGVNFHTLLRERQRIQSEGTLLPTDYEVLKRRRLLEKEYKRNYGGIKDKPYSQEDYKEAKKMGLDLDNWNDYKKFAKLEEYAD